MNDFEIKVWPADSRQITQPFGVNPQIYARFGAPGHTGIDLGGIEGVTTVYAATDGRVTTTRQQEDGFGNHVYVQHANGFTTIYGHLFSILVKQGDMIAAGTPVGKLGNTGFSTGPHLHFELRGPQGMPGWPRNIIDPTPFLLPHLGFVRPAGPYKEGWVVAWGVTVQGELAQANSGGVSLRGGPSQNHKRLNVVREGVMMIVTGGQQGEYLPVQVPFASLGEQAPAAAPPRPSPEFPPMVSTIDGWGFASYIRPDGNGLRGMVGEYGINLRAAPRRDAANIGIVKGGSSVTILGARSGEYFPVRAARSDFVGPINMVEASPASPAPGTLSGHGAVSANTCLGWGWTPYLDLRGEQAVVGQYGINLRASPSEFGSQIGVVKGLSVVTVVGKAKGEYTPVMVKKEDMLTVASPAPTVEQPEPLTAAPPPPTPVEEPEPAAPPADSTPGWAFAAAVDARGDRGFAGQFGLNLRDAPRRDGKNIGFVPGGAEMWLTGERQGEYLAVRVDDAILQPPLGSGAAAPTPTPAPAAPSPAAPAPAPTPPPVVEAPLLGQARLGLHASATPDISDAEIAEFKALRPGIIKVLSFHSAERIRRLAADHPGATWVVRAFLSMHNRNISPDQFLNDTKGDVRRTLNELRGRDVVVELHNEPNLTLEGLGSSWNNAAEFNRWWLQVLARFRAEFPGQRMIFPGLSPGPDQGGLRQADRPFLEACRESIQAADGLAMHAYWSNPAFPMRGHPDSGTQLVDDYVNRFRAKPIWITEASNNLGSDWDTKAREYLQFWQEMQRRPTVQGITYFVASAAPGTFPHEVWVGHHIGAKVGAR